MTTGTTLIHSIDWLVAWDAEEGDHVYLRNADFAFSGDSIDFVGYGFTGAAVRRIDGRGLMVAPGLLSLHSHPWSETLHKGYIEDFGNPLRQGQGRSNRAWPPAADTRSPE